MKRILRNIFGFAAIASFTGILALSCVHDELVAPQQKKMSAFEYIGTPTDVYLDITVGGLTVNPITKAEIGDGPVDDTEDERRVNNLWVFQYDESGEALISEPKYVMITNQTSLMNVPVKLSDNNGSPCIVYVVTNTDSNDWVKYSSASENYDGFASLDDLKAQTIPNSAPIRISGEEDLSALSIPMGGSNGEDSELVIKEGSVITVPVKRMFAKLEVTVTLVRPDDFEEASVVNFIIDKIPNACTVATTYNGDETWYYPSTSTFDVSRSFVPDDGEVDGDETVYGPFVIYVPESLQDTDNTNAVKLTPYIRLVDDQGAELSSRPSFTAYPGSWIGTGDVDEDAHTGSGSNYDIQRNCVYTINLTISVDDNVISPSANCIIAAANSTVAFYPYVRDEEPSAELLAESNWSSELEERYTFTTYLDPSDEAPESKKISYVRIIWQTKDCIGDSTQDGTVWIDDPADVLDERHRKIYVHAQNPGNALVGAYNSSGEIIWSWHIWVPNNGVHPEEGAIEYYHYQWDHNGIDTNAFVPGRLVMNLNLGAIAEKPETGVLNTDTFGLLYQWGRKDPFPAAKASPDIPGGKGGKSFFNYCDYTLVTSNYTYDIEVGVYDYKDDYFDMSGNDGSIATKGKFTMFDTNAANTVPGGEYGADDNTVILNSVRHPTTFIAASGAYTSTSDSATGTGIGGIGTYYNQGDWLPDDDDFLWGGGHTNDGTALHVYSEDSEGDALVNGSTIEAYLEDDYGPEKTIFDPCPYGWRISPGDIWLGFTRDGLNFSHSSEASKYIGDLNLVETDLSDVSKQSGFTMYMQGWKGSIGSETSFFPSQGSRISSGQPYNVGPICGNYHNATVDKDMTRSDWGGSYIRRVDILHFHSQNVSGIDGEYVLLKPFTNELWYFNKAVAGPVRCVRDTK